jgi:hypothetical protein
VFRESRAFLDQLSNYHLFLKKLEPWNYVCFLINLQVSLSLYFHCAHPIIVTVLTVANNVIRTCIIICRSSTTGILLLVITSWFQLLFANKPTLFKGILLLYFMHKEAPLRCGSSCHIYNGFNFCPYFLETVAT